MFKINIHNLRDGEHVYNFTGTSKDFDLDLTDAELTDEVKIIATLFKAGDQFTIKIELKGKFKFQCDRCLDDYVHEFDTLFDIIYKLIHRSSPADEFHDDADIKFIQPNTIFIDLKEDIRDFIFLSIPMKKAPEETDGVCSYCDKDVKESLKAKQQVEINPVWEKLIESKKINK